MAGSSAHTASRVLGPKVSPASVTECVWMGPMAPGRVAVTKASTEPPVKCARTANMASTVIRVPPSCHMDCPVLSHLGYFLPLSSYFLSLTGLWSVQSAAVSMAAATKVSAVTGRASVMSDGEEFSVTKVGQQHRHSDATNDPWKDEKNEKFMFESHFRPDKICFDAGKR